MRTSFCWSYLSDRHAWNPIRGYWLSNLLRGRSYPTCQFDVLKLATQSADFHQVMLIFFLNKSKAPNRVPTPDSWQKLGFMELKFYLYLGHHPTFSITFSQLQWSQGYAASKAIEFSTSSLTQGPTWSTARLSSRICVKLLESQSRMWSWRSPEIS